MSLNSNKRGKDFWGPSLWQLGHIYGITYHPSKAVDFENFWWLSTVLLPCDYCQKNLSAKLKKYPMKKYLDNREQAFFYTYFVHDLANEHISRHHPDNPKISPNYDDIRKYYINGIRDTTFWNAAFWDTLFILATTLKPQNSSAFDKFLWTSSSLLPRDFSLTFQNALRKYPSKAYLRNNNDAFFYVYLLYDVTSPRSDMVPPFDDLKSYYFHALGAECKECSV
jgi:hypothetical protein